MATFSVSLDTNVATILGAFKALPGKIQRASRAGLRIGLAAITGEVQRRMTTTFRTASPNGLRKSVSSSVSNDGLEGTITVNKLYAAIHEFGGTIVPKNRKFLSVPINPAARGHSPGDFANLQLIPRKGKPSLLVLPFGPSARVKRIGTQLGSRKALMGVRQAQQVRGFIPMFVLVKKVDMPARPYFFPAVKASLDQVPKAISQQINAALANK